jgi:hypothetical protein
LMSANDKISSLKVPYAGAGAYPSLWLFRDGWGSSPIYTYSSSAPTLASGIDNNASSVWAIDHVYVYEHAWFQGMGWQFDPGNSEFAGVLDEQISSLHVPPGWRVVLFTDHGYAGTSRTFYGGDYGFVGYDVNDQFSSIVVEEPAVAYVDPQSSTAVNTGSGPFAYLFPGYYSMTEMGIPNDSLSSIRVPSGYTAYLYWDEPFGSPTTALSVPTWSIPTVFNLAGGQWNDQTSSIVISKNFSP